MPRQRNRRASHSQRRRTTWIGNEITSVDKITVAAATSIVYQLFDLRLNPAIVGSTILRTRGLFRAMTDQVGAAEFPFGAIGMAVVDGEAFDAGIVSLPTPYTESDDHSWFFHSYFATDFDISAVGSSSNPFELEVDSKAMRKLQENDVIVWILQNQSATDALFFTWATRILIALP